jgi:hypothetical protein
MPKAFYICLLCSLLSVPLLGSSSAHAALIVNVDSSKCLDVKSGTRPTQRQYGPFPATPASVSSGNGKGFR